MLLDYNPILNKHIDTYISFLFNTVFFFLYFRTQFQSQENTLRSSTLLRLLVSPTVYICVSWRPTQV